MNIEEEIVELYEKNELGMANMSDVLRVIKNSIGSCGTCGYFRELDHNNKPRCKYVEIEVHPNFYCKDYILKKCKVKK